MNSLHIIITSSRKLLPCAAYLLTLLLLHGCSTYSPPYPSHPAPLPRPAPPRSEPAPQVLPLPPAHVPQHGPASSLYQGALHDLRQGKYQKAELQIERALRIEPKNSQYWYTLAQVKYNLQQYSQAIQFCLKSKSLAGSDHTLIRSNNGLIERSKRQLSR